MPRVPSRVNGTKVTQTSGNAPVMRVQTGDFQSQQAQRSIESGTGPARGLPFGDGNLIANITFVAAVSQDINHLLGAPVAGFFAVRIVALSAATIFEFAGLPDSMKSKQIRLRASVNCVADVWFFK